MLCDSELESWTFIPVSFCTEHRLCYNLSWGRNTITYLFRVGLKRQQGICCVSGPTWKEGWAEVTLAAGSAYDLLFRTLLLSHSRCPLCSDLWEKCPYRFLHGSAWNMRSFTMCFWGANLGALGCNETPYDLFGGFCVLVLFSVIEPILFCFPVIPSVSL